MLPTKHGLNQTNASEKLTCRRTRHVWSHRKNSGEASMSKDRPGSESSAPSWRSSIGRQSSGYIWWEGRGISDRENMPALQKKKGEREDNTPDEKEDLELEKLLRSWVKSPHQTGNDYDLTHPRKDRSISSPFGKAHYSKKGKEGANATKICPHTSNLIWRADAAMCPRLRELSEVRPVIEMLDFICVKSCLIFSSIILNKILSRVEVSSSEKLDYACENITINYCKSML
ncbi:hypothetical protein Tco_0103635 [Tanacetum coccineum]